MRFVLYFSGLILLAAGAVSPAFQSAQSPRPAEASGAQQDQEMEKFMRAFREAQAAAVECSKPDYQKMLREKNGQD